MEENNGFTKEDIEKNKAVAAISYIIFFLPLIICKDSQYGKFHANQGLLLLLTSIAGSIIISLLRALLPLSLWGFMSILSTLWGIAILVFCIISIVNTLNGETKELPIVGKFRIIK